MALTLLIDGENLTDVAESLSWSSVDPGGFETCQFELPSDMTMTPGATVAIWDGLSRVWMGRVEEPGDNFDQERAPSQITCVGAGAVLKDKLLSMVWIDRDLSRWQGPSLQRQINLIGSNFTPDSADVTPDATTGNPSLETGFTDAGGWSTTTKPTTEGWYDAGPGNLIGRIRADWTRGAKITSTDTNWQWDAWVISDDVASAGESSSNLRAAGPGTADVSASGSRRYALLRLMYNAAGGATADSTHWAVYWTNVRVYGGHGLTIHGATSATEGVTGSDVAAYVAGLAGLQAGVIADSSGSLIVPHAAYYTPVTYEQHVDDMARLLGWHWGVWEPLSTFDDTPRLDFRPPPSSATAVIARSDCQNLKLSQRLSDFHDTAIVTYTDAAGTSGQQTVTLANPRLPAGMSRDLPVDVGTSTATIAAALGLDELLLEQQQTRAAGSVQLPAMVALPNGGLMPSHLLRPGIDRLRITGLPNAGLWTDDDTRRVDTFRLARISSDLRDGAIITTAELDAGANLLDTLQARLAVAGVLAS